MKTRIWTAVLGIPAMLLLLFWPGGVPWMIGVAAVMVVAGWEYVTELRKKDIRVHWVTLALFAGYFWILAGLPFSLSLVPLSPKFVAPPADDSLLVPSVLLLLVTLAGDLFWNHRAPVKNVGATLFGIVYIGSLFPFLVKLRYIASGSNPLAITPILDPPVDPRLGAWCVLAVLLVIWSADSAAYFTGRQFGKHKCTPAISPNKTWEGVYGGLAAAMLAGLIGLYPLMGWSLLGLGFGLLVGVAGIIGDLVESAIKRELGVKDFGSLLPGHGGILDRFDSLLFAAPVAYWLISMFGMWFF